MIRTDGRTPDRMREVRITRGYIPHAEGSALIELGRTRVVCTASYEESVPAFLKGSGQGWVTAEYSMLPRANVERTQREAVVGKQGGRTMEIQRLIGRSLRAVTDLTAFPEKSFWLDCDVIEADGGTRTASITGSYVALHDAFETMIAEGVMTKPAFNGMLAAVSLGVVSGTPMLDLCYEEDYHAELDLNLVANDRGEVIEIQGTAENRPVSRSELDALIDMGLRGVAEMVEYMKHLLTGEA